MTGAEALSGSPVASTSAPEMPCAINGLSSGLSGGALGYVFGFGKCATFYPRVSGRFGRTTGIALANSQAAGDFQEVSLSSTEARVDGKHVQPKAGHLLRCYHHHHNVLSNPGSSGCKTARQPPVDVLHALDLVALSLYPHQPDISFHMQTFAIMGGLYAAVSCFMKRLRQKDDGKPHNLHDQTSGSVQTHELTSIWVSALA